jgi:transposase InsO family protein
MRDSYPTIGLIRICRLLGVTRQALYQHGWRRQELTIEAEIIIQHVMEIRKRHPVIGTRKLYGMLEPILQEHAIKMGRDKLFELLAQNKLLVRRRKRRISTTQSYHRFHKYPNLIRDMQITRKNQLWVSDITYYKVMEKFVYLSLITDAYSHKIIGYQVAETLEAVHSLQALQMAVNATNFAAEPQIIHHSDRGIQYCSEEYVRLLNKHQILISMTDSGDPRENSVAERINGIIKGEYLSQHSYGSITELEIKLSQVICLYNNERPHLSCSMLPPAIVHERDLLVKRKWKSYYRCRTNQP